MHTPYWDGFKSRDLLQSKEGGHTHKQRKLVGLRIRLLPCCREILPSYETLVPPGVGILSSLLLKKSTCMETVRGGGVVITGIWETVKHVK